MRESGQQSNTRGGISAGATPPSVTLRTSTVSGHPHEAAALDASAAVRKTASSSPPPVPREKGRPTKDSSSAKQSSAIAGPARHETSKKAEKQPQSSSAASTTHNGVAVPYIVGISLIPTAVPRASLSVGKAEPAAPQKSAVHRGGNNSSSCDGGGGDVGNTHGWSRVAARGAFSHLSSHGVLEQLAPSNDHRARQVTQGGWVPLVSSPLSDNGDVLSFRSWESASVAMTSGLQPATVSLHRGVVQDVSTPPQPAAASRDQLRSHSSASSRGASLHGGKSTSRAESPATPSGPRSTAGSTRQRSPPQSSPVDHGSRHHSTQAVENSAAASRHAATAEPPQRTYPSVRKQKQGGSRLSPAGWPAPPPPLSIPAASPAASPVPTDESHAEKKRADEKGEATVSLTRPAPVESKGDAPPPPKNRDAVLSTQALGSRKAAAASLAPAAAVSAASPSSSQPVRRGREKPLPPSRPVNPRMTATVTASTSAPAPAASQRLQRTNSKAGTAGVSATARQDRRPRSATQTARPSPRSASARPTSAAARSKPTAAESPAAPHRGLDAFIAKGHAKRAQAERELQLRLQEEERNCTYKPQISAVAAALPLSSRPSIYDTAAACEAAEKRQQRRDAVLRERDDAAAAERCNVYVNKRSTKLYHQMMHRESQQPDTTTDEAATTVKQPQVSVQQSVFQRLQTEARRREDMRRELEWRHKPSFKPETRSYKDKPETSPPEMPPPAAAETVEAPSSVFTRLYAQSVEQRQRRAARQAEEAPPDPSGPTDAAAKGPAKKTKEEARTYADGLLQRVAERRARWQQRIEAAAEKEREQCGRVELSATTIELAEKARQRYRQKEMELAQAPGEKTPENVKRTVPASTTQSSQSADFMARLQQSSERKDQSMIRLREELLAEELRDCTFRPRLNERSEEMAKRIYVESYIDPNREGSTPSRSYTPSVNDRGLQNSPVSRSAELTCHRGRSPLISEQSRRLLHELSNSDSLSPPHPPRRTSSSQRRDQSAAVNDSSEDNYEYFVQETAAQPNKGPSRYHSDVRESRTELTSDYLAEQLQDLEAVLLEWQELKQACSPAMEERYN